MRLSGVSVLCLGACSLMCQAPAAPQKPAAPERPAPPEIVLSPSKPAAAPLPPESPSAAPGAPTAVASPASPLTCIAPPDPELDRESPWSHDLGQRLERALPNLSHCASELAPGTTETVAVRLIYAQDGMPRSQHIVRSSPAACEAAECIHRALAAVRAPKLAIEQGAFDLALILEPGVPPRRTEDEQAGLADDEALTPPSGCVDPVPRADR